MFSKGDPDPKTAVKLVYFITSSILDSDLEVGLERGNIIGLKLSYLSAIHYNTSGVNSPPWALSPIKMWGLISLTT